MANARWNRIYHARLELLDVWLCSCRRRRRRGRRRSTRRRRSGRRSRCDRLSRLESRGSRRVSDPSRSRGNKTSAVRARQSLSSGSATTRGTLQVRKRREWRLLFTRKFPYRNAQRQTASEPSWAWTCAAPARPRRCSAAYRTGPTQSRTCRRRRAGSSRLSGT